MTATNWKTGILAAAAAFSLPLGGRSFMGTAVARQRFDASGFRGPECWSATDIAASRR